VIVIHGEVVWAVHEHVAPADTVREPVPPPAAVDCVRGETAYVHGVAPAWATVNSRPAIVIVPARPPPLFAATLNVTVPLPLPVLPDVTVIQGTLLVAVQPQPVAPVTVIGEPVPPLRPSNWNVGAMVKPHCSTACWRTVILWPATTRTPVRSAPAFALAANVTVPLPLPLTPPVSAIQPASLFAVHAQPLAAVMLTVAVPPLPETV
jgi:hypothetical protein